MEIHVTTVILDGHQQELRTLSVDYIPRQEELLVFVIEDHLIMAKVYEVRHEFIGQKHPAIIIVVRIIRGRDFVERVENNWKQRPSYSHRLAVAPPTPGTS